MTLPSSAKTRSNGLLAVSSILCLAAWMYTAGGVFMFLQGRPFSQASLLTLYQYTYHYGSVSKIQNLLFLASLLAAIIILLPAAILFAPTKISLFGNARFATRREIKRAGLLGDTGIIVGKLGKQYLMFSGAQHAIVSAPTRSGKGVGIVIPNLLSWPESLVVLDIKQENWDITSGYRQHHGQDCFLFNPVATDYRTHRYNPLAYISEDPNFRIDDIQKIASMLFPDQPGTDVIWTATPRSLFLGVVLYLIETPGKLVTLGQVLRETLVDGDGAQYFLKIIEERSGALNPLSSTCTQALKSYCSIASDNTRAGVMTSFRSRLELWMNPLVDAATSGNDFDLRDLRKKRMSIYLGVTPDNLNRLAPLMNLFFQQLIDLNTRELPLQNKTLKHSVLLLMDEFTAIGKIPILAKGVGYVAGYGLRLLPIIQSPSQLTEVYGKDAAQTFLTNQAMNVIFAPKASEVQTAREISEALGYQTVKGVSESKSKGWFAKRNPSESRSDQRRALLLPQELTSLGPHKELLVMENLAPVLAEKVSYFKDPIFVDRLKEISPTLQKIGKKLPSQENLNTAIQHSELCATVPRIDIEQHLQTVAATASHKQKKQSSNTSSSGQTSQKGIARPDLSQLKMEDYSLRFGECHLE